MPLGIHSVGSKGETRSSISAISSVCRSGHRSLFVT